MRFAIIILFITSFALADTPKMKFEKEQLKFEFRENNEEGQSYDCEHKVELEPYDWEVSCLVGKETRKFSAHVAADWYPRTVYGTSTHEILYWLTDRTEAKAKVTSQTTWVHQDKEDTRAKVLELSQGVDNDANSLKLTVKIQRGSRGMSVAEARKFCEKWLPAWVGGSKAVDDLLAKYYTADAVYADPNQPKGVSGEKLREFFKLFFDNNPDWKFEIVSIYPTEKGFILHYNGTLPIKGTDIVLKDFRGIDILEFTDGKISRQEGFFDRAGIPKP